MKNPNGYGGISKLPGNRRKPYRVRLTAGWQYQTDGKPLQKYHTLGYYTSRRAALIALADYNKRLKSAAYHFRRALQPVV
jgi:hypothetical protein